jgi:tetratricopeptide (TPR) repeat protein
MAVLGFGFANAQVGSIVENAELATVNGGKEPLLGDATANVFIFFNPGQENSQQALSKLSAVQQEMTGRSVRWVGVISGRDTTTDLASLNLTMPVLVDVGDALFGRLGVALRPVVGIADRDHRLVAYQPFTKVNYADVVRAQVRHLLKEISDQELAEAIAPPVTTETGGEAASIAHRRLRLAEKLFEAKKYPEALASVRKTLEKDPGQSAAQALLGRILFAQGDKAQALEAFAKALELDPANAEALEGRKACEAQGR